MSLREEQVALTRQAIVEAVAEITTDPDSGPITVAEVSRRSGISPATIYRHFPNRDVLVSAAAVERFLTWTPPEPGGSPEEDLRAYLVALWGDLAANLALARQGTVTEAGRELRASRFGAYRPLVEQALRAAGRDPRQPEIRHLLACLDVLTSAHAFLDLHDRQGLAVEDAVDAVIWGSRALLDAVGVAIDIIPMPGPAIGHQEGTK